MTTPVITSLPTPPNPSDRSTFNTRAYPWSLALGTFTTEVNSATTWMNTKTAEVLSYSIATDQYSTQAADNALIAQQAAAAAMNGPTTYAETTESITFGTGSRTFYMHPGKTWSKGQFIVIASATDPTKYMSGQITKYDSLLQTINVNVTTSTGVGTEASWVFSLTANSDAGFVSNTPSGNISSVTVQGAINELDAEKANSSSVREKLTGNRSYYVRSDGDDDANNGLSNTSGGAFATIQKAVDSAASIDLGIYDVIIYVGVGTWTNGVTLKTLTGAGTVIIRGINSNMTDTVINTAGLCFNGDYCGTYSLQHMRITNTFSGSCIQITGAGATLKWGFVDFGPSAGAHIIVFAGAYAEAIGDYKISGGAWNHLGVYEVASARIVGVTVTITSSPAFASFITAQRIGSALVTSTTFSGAATGMRYECQGNGVLFTGSGATYLPGDAAGTTSTGGQYL